MLFLFRCFFAATRRYELDASKPRAIIKTVDGIEMEPYEDLQIDVPSEFVLGIMEALGTMGPSCSI